MEVMLQDLDFENEKLEELKSEIKDQVNMIKNYTKQIGFILQKYKTDYNLDFEEDIIDLLCDEIIKVL